jgi:hypothetical protein
VIDASELAEGFVTVRMRTWNVLYAIKAVTPRPNFSEPHRMKIEDLWHWSGAPWGGPVPPED